MRGHILIVDDDPPIVEFIAEALTEEGYTVRTARNGPNARAMIAAHPRIASPC